MRLRLLSLFTIICIAGLNWDCLRARAAESAQTARPVVLNRLLLAANEKEALAMADPGAGTEVAFKDLPLFDTTEFRREVHPLIGHPINDVLIHQFAEIVSAYVRAHDRLTVNVSIPKQNASNGVVRLVVQVGRYKDIIVRGNRWFSSKLIEEKLGVKPGDEIRVSQLDKAISWINDNPFRYTKAIINNRTGDPTRADLIIAVQDAAPFRVIGTYDNAGVPLLGSDRYTAAVQWGNAWGLDHQITYQYTRSDIPRYFQAHSLDYVIPLPSHNQIQVDAAYASFNPIVGYIPDADPSKPGTPIATKGTNIIGDIHYLIPVNKAPWTIQYSFGVDFKRTDNNLIFGGAPVHINAVDVLQGTAAVTLVRKDRLGGWSAALTTFLSPGHLTHKQNDATYAVRGGSQPRYIYATLDLQRLTDIGDGWQLVTKLNTQMTSTNLQGSEQMSIGGADTVRGYQERIFSGDQGLTFSNELQTPIINAIARAIPRSLKTNNAVQARGLAFIDFGDVKYHKTEGSDIRLYSLASAGLGLNCAVGNTLSLSFSYGWRLRNLPVKEPGSGRGSIRVSMSY